MMVANVQMRVEIMQRIEKNAEIVANKGFMIVQARHSSDSPTSMRLPQR